MANLVDWTMCQNCREMGAWAFRVGREKGTQRDPYHSSLFLCAPCREFLEEGNLTDFVNRHRTEAEVANG